jgi:REP element-mobilizing transposase RayT
MPRPLRIEYPGAIYHVMSRGDRREMIFLADGDRHSLLKTLGESCAKTGWEIHTCVPIGNHFHFVVETPQPLLCLGMKWLLGTVSCLIRWGLYSAPFRARLTNLHSDTLIIRSRRLGEDEFFPAILL